MATRSMFKSEEEFVESAREIYERNSTFNHYVRWPREPKALNLIVDRLREVGEAKTSITYSNLFGGVEITITNTGTHVFRGPEWDSFEKGMIDNVFEYLTYNSYAMCGVMVTALIVNEKGTYLGLPDKDFSLLFNKIQAWPWDPPKSQRVTLPTHRELVKKHTRMAHEFYKSRRDARGISFVEPLP